MNVEMMLSVLWTMAKTFVVVALYLCCMYWTLEKIRNWK